MALELASNTLVEVVRAFNVSQVGGAVIVKRCDSRLAQRSGIHSQQLFLHSNLGRNRGI